MSSRILTDERVLWLRQKVAIALDIQLEQFDAYFIDSLERASSAHIARETLFEFLTDKYGCGSTIFFAVKKWVEEYEGINLYDDLYSQFN